MIEILERIANNLSKSDALYFFAFQSVHRILLDYREIQSIKKELKRNNIKLIIIPCLIFPRLIGWFNAKWYIIPFIFLQSFPMLLFLVFIKKIDILHCRSYPIMLAAMAVKKLKKRVKIVFDPRSPFPEENITANRWTERSFTYKLWKKIEKLYLNNSDITIAIANTYVEHFKKISPNSKFVIIPNNVDVQKFTLDKKFRVRFRSKMGIASNEIIFAYSGSMGNHWNNPKIYAKFLIKLRELGVKHRFLFLTPNINELKKKFDQYDIKSSEYLAIAARLEDMPKYLSTADFGINLMERPDIRMSIKTVEYLAMGLPIIINSKVLDAKEIVEHYGVGLILRDIENINLEEIRNFIQKRNQLTLKCRKVACKKFSTEKIAKQYVNIYIAVSRRIRYVKIRNQNLALTLNKRGSAKYFKDVPIPEEYKFEDKEENIPWIVEKIKDCFKNFELHYKNFENYRNITKSEPKKFIKDLKSIFEVKRN